MRLRKKEICLRKKSERMLQCLKREVARKNSKRNIFQMNVSVQNEDGHEAHGEQKENSQRLLLLIVEMLRNHLSHLRFQLMQLLLEQRDLLILQGLLCLLRLILQLMKSPLQLRTL